MWAAFYLRLPEGGERWGRGSLYLGGPRAHSAPHQSATSPRKHPAPRPAVRLLVPLRLSTFLHGLPGLGHEVPLPEGKAVPSLVL